MRCEDTRWRLVLYLDGELAPSEEEAVREHLASCAACSAELAGLRSTEDVIGEAVSAPREDPRAIERIARGITRERRLLQGTATGRRARAAVLIGLTSALLGLGALGIQAYLSPLTTEPRLLYLECPSDVPDDGVFSVRVRCYSATTGHPVGDERVVVSLSATDAAGPVDTTSGRTDGYGFFHGRLAAPQSSESQTLRLTARCGRGVVAAEIAQTVRLVPRRLALIWTDRSVVAPGNEVAVACALLHEASSRPAQAEGVTVEVRDPMGQAVLVKSTQTGDDGTLQTPVRISELALPGTYSATLRWSGGQVSRNFAVRRRGSADLTVSLSVDSPEYAPGEMARVTVFAERRTREPAAGAAVDLVVRDEPGTVLARLRGRTDTQGMFRGRFRVPPGLAAEGTARLYVEAVVEDARLDRGVGHYTLSVCAPELRVLVVPQGGAVIAGRPAMIDILVVSSSGWPVAAGLSGSISGRPIAMDTGPDGTASVWCKAVSAGGRLEGVVRARDGRGRHGQARISFPPGPPGTIAIVPDRGACRPGEQLGIDVFSDSDGLVLVELQRQGVPVWSGSVVLVDGAGRLDLPVESSFEGTLGLVARWPDSSPDGVGRAPCVFVDPSGSLRVSVEGDLTGRASQATIRVTSASGAGVRSTLCAVALPASAASAPGAAEPVLSHLRVSDESVLRAASGAFSELGRAVARGEHRTRARALTRGLLTLASTEVCHPLVSRLTTAGLASMIADRQLQLYGRLAVAACALFAATFIGLLLAGELRLRGAWAAEHAEAASLFLTQLRWDLVVSGVLLLACAATVGYLHVLAAGLPPGLEPSRASSAAVPSHPIGTGTEVPSGAGMPQPTCETQPETLPTASASTETDRRGVASVELSLPDACRSLGLAVLAVAPDGRLGYSIKTIPVPNATACTLEVDPAAPVGSVFAGLVRIANRTAFPVTVGARLRVVGPLRTEDSEWRDIALPPHHEHLWYLDLEPLDVGSGEVLLDVRTPEGSERTLRSAVEVLPRRSAAVIAAGLVGSDGVAIPIPGLPLGNGRLELALASGRRATAAQLLQSSAPPWMVIDEPVWASFLAAAAIEVFDRSSVPDARWRQLARQRMADAEAGILAHRVAGGFAEVPGGQRSVRSTSLAVLGLGMVEPWMRGERSVLGACREELQSLLRSEIASLAPAEQALAAWALARSGAPGDTVRELLASIIPALETDPPDAQTLAMVALAHAALGDAAEASAACDRLAEAAGGLEVPAAPSSRSVFGNTGDAAQADIAALTALAFRAAPPTRYDPPPSLSLLDRIVSLRRADGLFGGAATNGVCGLAVLALLRDTTAAARARVGGLAKGDETIELPSDRWASLVLEPADLQAAWVTIAGSGDGIVQYLLLGREADVSQVRGELAASPTKQRGVGLAVLTAANDSPMPFGRAELRVRLPAGVDPYIPDLDALVATGAWAAYGWARGELSVLVGDLAAGSKRSVSFRVRAARVRRVPEVRVRASVVPAGAARA